MRLGLLQVLRAVGVHGKTGCSKTEPMGDTVSLKMSGGGLTTFILPIVRAINYNKNMYLAL
jgi:hypothetical protein